MLTAAVAAIARALGNNVHMAAKKTSPVVPGQHVTDETDVTETGSAIGRRRREARTTGNPDYEARRRKVLEAAIEVFQRNGYRGTRLAQISKLLGGDRASLYYYFSGKPDLFHALVFDAVEANVLRAEAIRDSAMPSLERLETLVRESVLSFEQHPAVSVFAMEDDRTLEAEPRFVDLRELNRRYADALHSILDQAIAENAVEVRSTQAATIIVMGALNWVNRWFRPQRELNGAELADLVSTFVVRGLTVTADAKSPTQR